MKSSKLSQNYYIVRLETGDEINKSIADFCKKNRIKNAAVWGIGSIESPTLAHYRMYGKEYKKKKIEGIMEIVSLMGNVAMFEGKPLPHLHITVSNEEMTTFAGHLVEGKCSATVEIIIQKFTSKFEKKQNEKVGLRLWDI